MEGLARLRWHWYQRRPVESMRRQCLCFGWNRVLAPVAGVVVQKNPGLKDDEVAGSMEWMAVDDGP